MENRTQKRPYVKKAGIYHSGVDIEHMENPETGGKAVIERHEEDGTKTIMELVEDENGKVTVMDDIGGVEYKIRPKEPRLDKRLKELGILVKSGKTWIVDKRGLFLAVTGHNRKPPLVTHEEYAYANFIYDTPEPEDRKKIEAIYYRVEPNMVIRWTPKKEQEKLHRVPRSYQKTVAKIVGKDNFEPTLFTLPTIIQRDERDKEDLDIPQKDTISKNTAILGGYLFQLWELNGRRRLEISNIGYMADMIGSSNFKTKYYLLHLGGYAYPIIDSDEDGGLTLSMGQLYNVIFKYGKAVRDKYPDGNYPLIGTKMSKFIKDEPVDKIFVEPNPIFIKAMEGKGLGSVLVVNDKFTLLALKLTEIAYKILNYTASNKPTKKINEDSLIKDLGLEKQLKTQGRPRVRETIIRGLQELKDNGHIKSYSYPEGKGSGMYIFTYSDKYIKHQENKEKPEVKIAP